MKSLAASAALLALGPYAGVSTHGDLYRNSRLGLSLRKPKGWTFASIADFAALRDRQVLQLAIDEQEELLKDPDNLPVFLFEDPGSEDKDFAPCIGLFDEDPDGLVPSCSEEEPFLHETVLLRSLASAHREFSTIQPPKHLQLVGSHGTVATFSYLHELDDGRECTLLVHSLLVFREPRVHTFYLVDSLHSPRVHEALWDTFFSSIRYT